MPTQNEQSDRSGQHDRRLWERYPLATFQAMALIKEGRLPPLSVFESVRCIDISRRGLAFYRRNLLESNELVVALGESPDLVYLSARVVSSTIVERGTKRFFRVGCEFNGRLEVENDCLVRRQLTDLETAFQLLAGSPPNSRSDCD